MMTSDFIVEVSEADFEYQVVAYSEQVPVIVDFWAEWCAPCRVLGPILERLAEEAQGGFRLAKVNVDENPNLARSYHVHGIPAVKAFRDGKLVAEFTGVQPEHKVREFLQTLVPSDTDLMLEKAQGWLMMGEIEKAEQAFQDILDIQPAHPAAQLGLVKCLLLSGAGLDALYLLKDFPASKEYKTAENLMPLAKGLAEVERDLDDSDDMLDAAYANALRLVKRHNIPAALDGLLDVLRQNKRYRHGEARQVFLGLLELLNPEDPMVRQYRSELASVLF